MNPLSITLKNFLCYNTQEDGAPYVFDFRDHRLWSICGDNGAGKSAIFDAITYCLYGQHRGGQLHDEELVHRGASHMLAGVEFEHAGREYRVTRTITIAIRPRKGTQDVRRECRMEWLRPDGEWVDLPETASKSGLEERVLKVLGYGYDTFTASVLLLQGKSDQLIDAKGDKRFDILSGILNLSRYEHLAEGARDRAKVARARHTGLVKGLEEAPPPEQLQVDAAGAAALAAESAAESAAALREAAKRTLEKATEYQGRLGRLSDLRTKEAEMVSTLEDADTIRAEAEEAGALARITPQLTKALESLRKAAKAEAEAAAASKAADKIDLERAGAEVTATKKDHDEVRGRHRALLKEVGEIRSEMDSIAPEVAKAAELKRLEGEIGTARAAVDELLARSAGLGQMRLREERLRRLRQATSLIVGYRTARDAEARAIGMAEGGDLDGELARRQAHRQEAEAAAVAAVASQLAADATAARAEAEFATAQTTLEERVAAKDEGTCSHCGQKVKAEHIEREVGSARNRVAALSTALLDARAAAADAKAEKEAVDGQLGRANAAEAEILGCAATARAARETLATLAGAQDYRQLPDDIRLVLEGPLTDLASGLEEVNSEVALDLTEQLKDLEKAAAAAVAREEVIGEWEGTCTQILAASTRERLVAAVARKEELHGLLEGLSSSEPGLSGAVEASEKALESAQRELGRLTDERRELGELAALRAEAGRGFRETADGSLTGVPGEFLPISAKVVEAAELRRGALADAPQRLLALREAQSSLDRLKGEIDTVQALVDVTLEADRVPVADAEGELRVAAESAGVARTNATERRREADALEHRREERLKTLAEAESLASSKAVWDAVAKLLGRSGIQTALMSSALEDIQEKANGMLSRTSGGQLQLSVSVVQNSKGGEEIQIRCLDAASAEQPLDVQFLSGGQRFRCAVALAAGIGQHAGMGGSIPSQIIDEGFGSLDAEGRREMLDEIRQMSEFYERVIVVSHMDSFHDQALFPARYELRRDGMRTVVTATL